MSVSKSSQSHHFAKEAVIQVREASDIVEVVSSYLPLKPAGRNYKALCPFHDEKTPSFVVSPDKQLFHCFGCKEGGDVFRFVMKMEQVSFGEALQLLANRAGISLRQYPEDEGSAKLYRLQEVAAEFFEKHLWSPRHRYGLEYLRGRHILDDTSRHFRLGLAPPGWENLIEYCTKKGISPKDLEEAGLAIPRRERTGHYDRFRRRVIFPIVDLQGRVVGFGGRALGSEDHPKYLNSPESSIFQKSRLLYGLYQGRKAISRQKRVALVEGYTDVLLAHQFGFPWMVATLGTALSAYHARTLRRFAHTVYLIYDGDSAGEKATLRSVSLLLEEELDIRIVLLPEGLDPADFLVRHGAEAFEEALEKSLDFLDFYSQSLQRRFDLHSLSGKGLALEEVLPVLEKLKNPVALDTVIQRLSEELGLSIDTLRERLEERTKRGKKRSSSPQRETKKSVWKEVPPEELTLLCALFKLPEGPDELLQRLPLEQLSSPTVKRIVSAFHKAWQQGIPWQETLEEGDTQALSELLLAEEREGYEKPYTWEVVEDCLNLLEAKHLQRKLQENLLLRKEAMKRGDFSRLKELTEEFLELRKLQEQKKHTLPTRHWKGLSF